MPIKFHPSSIGSLMGDAQSIDLEILPKELHGLVKKTKKTDDEKLILQPYKDMSLSAGAKTYIKNIAKEIIFGYRKEIDNRYLEKGIRLEAEAIQFINHRRFKRYEKNTERRTNDYLTGECDIWHKGVKTIDTKVSWSLDTFPALSEDCHDMTYEWQGRGYLSLWDEQEHEVVYVMLDTPDDLIKWEPIEIHKVSHIDPSLRITSITYKRDMELEKKMYLKLDIAQKYLYKVMDMICEEHGLEAKKYGDY